MLQMTYRRLRIPLSVWVNCGDFLGVEIFFLVLRVSRDMCTHSAITYKPRNTSQKQISYSVGDGVPCQQRWEWHVSFLFRWSPLPIQQVLQEQPTHRNTLCLRNGLQLPDGFGPQLACGCVDYFIQCQLIVLREYCQAKVCEADTH